MQYEAEEDIPLRYEDVLRESCICAESLGEFIFRFCIENAMWHAIHHKYPLSPLELDYLNQAKRSA
jgi:hypothetical protein